MTLLAATQPEGSLAARCLAAPERLVCHGMAMMAGVVAAAFGLRSGISPLTRWAAALFCLTVFLTVVWCGTHAPLPLGLPRVSLSWLWNLWQLFALLLFVTFHCGPRAVAWLLPLVVMPQLLQLLLYLLSPLNTLPLGFRLFRPGMFLTMIAAAIVCGIVVAPAVHHGLSSMLPPLPLGPHSMSPPRLFLYICQFLTYQLLFTLLGGPPSDAKLLRLLMLPLLMQLLLLWLWGL